MIRKLDKLWYGLLYRAHDWVVHRFIACVDREMAREAKADCRQEALGRLERHLASQKPHLN